MRLLPRLFARASSSPVEQRAIPDYLPEHIGGMFGLIGHNDSGVSINESNALSCSTVFACVSIIAQTIGTFPVHVTRRATGEKLYDHPLYQVLAVDPNPYMTPAVFREALLTNALLYGGAYAVLDRDELGHPTAFYPLRSSDVQPCRRAGQLLFDVRINGRLFTFGMGEIIHLLGWTIDGITPISPVRSARQSLGLAVAMERYAAKAFSGGNVGGILQTPPMKAEAMRDFITSWRTNYTGIENAFKVAVLPDPMKFIPTTLDPEKGQLVESRQAQVLEIARIWRVPPSMLGILEKSSYASLEQQNMSFYQQTILPWLVKLEQAISLVGFLERERPELELRFNADALLRTTTADRYSAYMQGRQGGWLSINDIRRKEGLPPIEGGDVHLQPLNMAPVNAPAPTPAPAKSDPAAARSLLEDAARRLLIKESKALIRAAKKYQGKPDEFRQWAEQWYATHEPLVVRVLSAPIKAAGLETDPADYAKAHCADSIRAIAAAVDAGTDMMDVSDEFTDIRPGEVAGQLLERNTDERKAA